jgi:hypothetical protein
LVIIPSRDREDGGTVKIVTTLTSLYAVLDPLGDLGAALERSPDGSPKGKSGQEFEAPRGDYAR